MTVKEIRDKFASENEVWLSKEIKATKENDGDINFSFGGSLIAWIPNSISDLDDVEGGLQIISVFSIAGIFEWSKRLFALAETLEVQLKGTPAVLATELEQAEPRESINELRLSGMVEAYEKIVIGRELNISR